MKKALLGTSALVAASVLAAGPATAAEPLKLGLGGYMEQSLGFVDHDGDGTTQVPAAGPGGSDGYSEFSETEVHFKGSTTLDNGIKISVQIELEGGSSTIADDIDEAYMTLTSPTLGQVIIGSENMPNYKMHYGAPTVSRQGFDSSDYDLFWVGNVSGLGGVDHSFGNTSGRLFSNDSMHVAYYTPRFAGFQAGVGYAAEAGALGSAQGNLIGGGATREDGLSLGLNYRGDFDGIGFNASFGYITWANDTVANNVVGNKRTPQNYQAGANITWSGFAVGVAWSETNDNRGGSSAGGVTGDSWTVNVGASYKTGPYGVSVGWQISEGDGVQTAAFSGENELDRWEIAGTYNLGPGINLHGAVSYKNEEGEIVGNADDLESWVGVAGIVVSF